MTIISKGIEGLKETLGQMSTAAQDMLDLAIETLETASEEKRDAVLAADSHLNEFELKLDHMCEQLLALQEAYAVDFRYIFSAIKSTRDLERIGDESKVVARWAVRRGEPADDQLRAMAAATRELVADAVVSLRTQDTVRAARVVKADRHIDAIEKRILDSRDSVPDAFIAHALERIGDRAVNVAENVIYTVSAEDIRHVDDPKR